MRLEVVELAAAFTLVAIPALPACSNSDSAASSDGGSDATIGPSQAVGAPCNEAIASPCVASTDGCSAVACLGGVCTVTPLGENADCADVALPMTNTLCDSGAACASGVCGFLVGEGCSVQGVCVTPVDASAALPPACGCDGLPDPYVAVGFTASPAASPVACDDSGATDAGEDGAGDGSMSDGSIGNDAQGADAGVDASDGASARDAATASDASPE
jgi:hypothetical protein